MSARRVVLRDFKALDTGDASVIPELFAPDCRIHRPELAEPLVGLEAVQRVVGLARQIYERFETTPLDLFEVDDAVILRLRHDAVHRGEWRTRLGTFDVAGKPVSWEALVLFRLRGDRIVEERVFRDELGMLLQVGAVEPV